MSAVRLRPHSLAIQKSKGRDYGAGKRRDGSRNSEEGWCGLSRESRGRQGTESECCHSCRS